MADVEVHIVLGGATLRVGTLYAPERGGDRAPVVFEYHPDWLNNGAAFSLEPALQLGSDAFTYDSLNRMKTGAGSGTFRYDPLNRLMSIGGSGLAGFAYDGLNIAGEYAANGAVLKRYVHAPGIDQPLVWYEGSGTADRRYLHRDERGSIIAITNSSGGVLGINSYDSWGIPAGGNTGRFGYTG